MLPVQEENEDNIAATGRWETGNTKEPTK